MIKLNSLTDEEIKYICNAIHPEEAQGYFKANPKYFQQIKPGFRPTSIKTGQTGKFLYDYRSKKFISDFIEQHINVWVKEVTEHIDKCVNNGDTRNQAYIKTFPESYFKKNINLYFKLIGEEIDSETKQIITEITEIQNSSLAKQAVIEDVGKHVEKIRLLESQINEKESILKKMKSDLSAKDKKINKLESSLNNINKEVCKLKDQLKVATADNKGLKKINNAVSINNKELEAKNKRVSEQNNRLDRKYKQSEIRNDELSKRIIELEKILSDKEINYLENDTLIRPTDLDTFQEFVSYNFENIGINCNKYETALLLQYLKRILFVGTPILLNMISAHNLAECIANSITGKKSFDRLSYLADITAKDIVNFLNSAGRVVCLDGFVGNFDELALIEILTHYKSKIVFLSYEYERTLAYVPEEILSYAFYLNLIRFPEFMKVNTITEDSAVLEESPYECDPILGNERIRTLANNIMTELGFSAQVISRYIAITENDNDLDQMLIFTVLPYIVDVCRENPYLLSSRLQKYAGDGGKSQIKGQLLRWYGQ